PTGGNLLLRMRDPNWIGIDENGPISPLWPPSDPYTGPAPPCRNFTDSWGGFRSCTATATTTTVLTQSADHVCWPTSTVNCIRTWEIIGTYYAPTTGLVRLCMTHPDDGTYVNWSAGYDPAASAGPTGPYTNVAETPNFSYTWNSAPWPVTVGRAYRFSIRI